MSFEFFSEMFVDASDRARFLAIILSAFFVGLGVWYTQHQINIRETKSFRLSKIEELYKAAKNCLHSLTAIQDLIGGLERLPYGSRNTEAKQEALIDSKKLPAEFLEHHANVQMIINLYFPNAEINHINIVDLDLAKAIEDLTSPKQILEYEDQTLENLHIEAEHYVQASIELSQQINK
jgi:hypothetical protein